MTDHATTYRVTVYADKDEFWPWWDLSTESSYIDEPAGTVPAELWQRYSEASRAYWTAKNEIVDLLGLEKR